MIPNKDQLSEVSLNNAEFKNIVVNCDELDTGLEVVSQEETAMAQRLEC